MSTYEIDFANRTLQLSVRELADFQLYPHRSDGSNASRWRAEIGTEWHQTLRSRLSDRYPDNADFEVSISGSINVLNWSLHLRGRIDQRLKKDAEIELIEVKSVQFPLPQSEDYLRAKVPEYFRQTALYHQLYRFNESLKTPVRSSLLFVDIHTGVTQKISLGQEDSIELESHLLEVVDYLEKRHQRLEKLRKLTICPPFQSWRAGQAETRKLLQQKAQSASILLFQAPTGFGKTGLALESALDQLVSGEVRRIFFLTGKTTGQLPIQNQLQTMGGPHSGIRHLILHNRQTLDPESSQIHQPITDSPEISIAEQWRNSGYRLDDLFSEGTISLQEIQKLAAQFALPASALLQFFLPHADIWIGDYNYLFDPQVRAAIDNPILYRPEETFLIIDEAHNLPSRVAASWSWTLHAREIESILTEIYFLKFASQLHRSLDRLLALLKKTNPTDAFNPAESADWEQSLKEIDRDWKASFIAIEELSPEARQWFWELPHRIDTFNRPFPTHFFSPEKGQVRRECLDPASWIQSIIQQHARTIFMSATLHPIETFKSSVNLHQSAELLGKHRIDHLIAHAPWQESAFSVAIDSRVDTRFHNRPKTYPLTAQTIIQIQNQIQEPFVVFFPSYRYAETIAEYLSFHYPLFRTALQPRDSSTDTQQSLLEFAFQQSDALFLILGSRLSEGIDSLGGKIRFAMIVGPALPEVNPVQKAKMQAAPSHSAFREVYQVPAMRKINQAIGRLVRAPEHTATILLHCFRFSDPSFSELLNPQCQPQITLRNNDDFANWLQTLR